LCGSDYVFELKSAAGKVLKKERKRAQKNKRKVPKRIRKKRAKESDKRVC